MVSNGAGVALTTDISRHRQRIDELRDQCPRQQRLLASLPGTPAVPTTPGEEPQPSIVTVILFFMVFLLSCVFSLLFEQGFREHLSGLLLPQCYLLHRDYSFQSCFESSSAMQRLRYGVPLDISCRLIFSMFTLSPETIRDLDGNVLSAFYELVQDLRVRIQDRVDLAQHAALLAPDDVAMLAPLLFPP